MGNLLGIFSIKSNIISGDDFIWISLLSLIMAFTLKLAEHYNQRFEKPRFSNPLV
jgi:hypothetical protein